MYFPLAVRHHRPSRRHRRKYRLVGLAIPTVCRRKPRRPGRLISRSPAGLTCPRDRAPETEPAARPELAEWLRALALEAAWLPATLAPPVQRQCIRLDLETQMFRLLRTCNRAPLRRPPQG